MHTTRVLRFVAPHHHHSAFGGFLLPPRSAIDVLASAGRTCYALLTQQAQRDAFVDACNRGIINPPVLGQANMGMAMILALYGDLNSPLLVNNGFKIEDFTAGAKGALERFHDLQITLQEDLAHDAAADGRGAGGVDDDETKRVAGDVDLKLLMRAMGKAVAPPSFPPLGGSEDGDRGGDDHSDKNDGTGAGALNRMLKRCWATELMEDSKSSAAQLRAMVTGEYFNVIELSSKTNCLLEKRFRYEAGSTEITNMALLSARAVLLPPKEESDSCAHDEPKSDNSLIDSFAGEKDLPVAAQVEVLYDIEQRFKAKDIDAADGDGEAEQLSKLRTSVLVAVFQGFLCNDPEGNESIRWKLALNRPAWEFP